MTAERCARAVSKVQCHSTESEGIDEIPEVTNPLSIKLCLFCGITTRPLDVRRCWADNWGNGINFRLPAEYDVRPELTVSESDRIWSEVTRQKIAGYLWAKDLLLIQDMVKNVNFTSGPDDLDNALTDAGVSNVATLRQNIEALWTSLETSGYRLYIYPDELRAGIIELDKWLDYYVRDVRGHIAGAIVTMVPKFRPARPSDTVRKAPPRIVRGVEAVVDRYEYSPSVRQSIVNIAVTLISEELGKSARRARSYLQVFQDVTATFRSYQIYPRTLDDTEVVPTTPSLMKVSPSETPPVELVTVPPSTVTLPRSSHAGTRPSERSAPVHRILELYVRTAEAIPSELVDAKTLRDWEAHIAKEYGSFIRIPVTETIYFEGLVEEVPLNIYRISVGQDLDKSHLVLDCAGWARRLHINVIGISLYRAELAAF